VINACHSSDLGRKLVDGGIPVVVSIDKEEEVLEKAAEIFNRNFLKFLVEGESPKNAFDYSKTILKNDKHGHSSCHKHGHIKEQCPWLKFYEKNGDKANNLLKPGCSCASFPPFSQIVHKKNCKDL
jgi:hypothetical protein